ncbi:MAG: DUF192 domain-containing protein [Candidatus Paceibacterota bacterium]
MKTRLTQIILAVIVCVAVVGIYFAITAPKKEAVSGENSEKAADYGNPNDPNGFFGSNFATTTVAIGDTEITVAIADSVDKQDKGLGSLNSMPEDTGMLFNFAIADNYEFWMKDMKFPLDIIWIDENNVITYIEKNATPESYPNTFASDQNSLNVLEVNAGFADKHGINIGDSISISENY